MQKINLKLQVSLKSGAEIRLAPPQHQAITDFVQNMVFNSPVPKVGRPAKVQSKKYPLGVRHWKPEEREQFAKLLTELKPEVKNNQQLFKRIGQIMGRTTASIATQHWLLTKTK